MRVNLHVEDSIIDEHADFFIKDMTPELERITQQLMNRDQIIWGYHDYQIVPVHPKDLVLVQTDSGKVSATLLNGEVLLIKLRIYQVSELLPENFLQTSKSEIVNINMIDHLEISLNGLINIVLKNKMVSPVARRRMHDLKRRLGL